jgi:hypothetical protein
MMLTSTSNRRGERPAAGGGVCGGAGDRRGADRDKSDCHFRKAATEIDNLV